MQQLSRAGQALTAFLTHRTAQHWPAAATAAFTAQQQACFSARTAWQTSPVSDHHHRHHLNLAPRFRAVLIDAAGTLILPSEPAALVYLRYAAKYGVELDEKEVLARYRWAYSQPWAHSSIRYVGDGRPFWKYIVSHATGCDEHEMFEDIYHYYQRPEAWFVAPGAVTALQRLRLNGVKLAVVSNFDTRLRPLLRGLNVDHLFDTIVVSAEVGAEKPNPVIFEAAVSALGAAPEELVHVGDDRRNDIWGARDAGITAWLWGVDVASFDEVADKVLSGRGHPMSLRYTPAEVRAWA